MRVYPARPSVQPGERLALHVATGPRFRVHFHRWDDGFRHVGSSDWQEGFAPPPGRAEVDWNWPGYAFEVPHDWCSGVYIAHLEGDGAPRLCVAMTSAAALFVVRGRGSAPLLYKIPLALLGPDWQELPHRERHSPGGGVHAAATAVHRGNRSVFTAGTTDWAQVLGKGDLLVERITRNVIETLMRC